MATTSAAPNPDAKEKTLDQTKRVRAIGAIRGLIEGKANVDLNEVFELVVETGIAVLEEQFGVNLIDAKVLAALIRSLKEDAPSVTVQIHPVTEELLLTGSDDISIEVEFATVEVVGPSLVEAAGTLVGKICRTAMGAYEDSETVAVKNRTVWIEKLMVEPSTVEPSLFTATAVVAMSAEVTMSPATGQMSCLSLVGWGRP